MTPNGTAESLRSHRGDAFRVSDRPALARRLGTGDAVVVGLCAMIGAGVFVAVAPESARD